MKITVAIQTLDESVQVLHYKAHTRARPSAAGFPVEIILDNDRLGRSFFAPLSYLDKRLLNRFLALAKARLKDPGLVALLRRIACRNLTAVPRLHGAASISPSSQSAS